MLTVWLFASMNTMKQCPTYEIAKKIADLFEVTLEYLVDKTAVATFVMQSVKRFQYIEIHF